MFKKKKKKLSEFKNQIENYVLTDDLDSNINMFKKILIDDDTLIIRFMENVENNIRCSLMFFDGMANTEIINENIIEPTLKSFEIKNNIFTIDNLKNQIILTNNIEKTSDINKIIETIYDGDVIMFLDGSPEVLLLFSKGWQSRQIEEPETERVMRGPREGFTESLVTNLSLIKRKLKTPDLKLKTRIMGDKTNTKICVCYLKDFANEKILQELNRRLDSIKINGILDSGYIQELIKDSPYSIFKTAGSTERPDIIAAKLLEGRIAIIIDGSPVAITVPFIFIEYFQSNDDYYINFYYSSISRMLRILGFFLSISTPAIYLSIITYHQEIIPTPLLFNVSAAREGVPFPTIIEVLVMLLIFEILRETGLRMPTFISQALSIVGVLVMGTAAVDAKLVSAPMVIVVGITGITGLILPKLNGPIIIIRLILIMLSSALGLYGYISGISCVLIYLFTLRSFGIPYMYKLMLLDQKQEINDTVIRTPWVELKNHPFLISKIYRRNKQ